MRSCRTWHKTRREAEWSDWGWQNSAACRPPDHPPGDPAYPAKATPYYLSLVKRWDSSDPIIRQALPLPEEAADDMGGLFDPLGERRDAVRPCECVVHRHAGRALFFPTWSCAVNCRFCFRRSRQGRILDQDREEGLAYIASAKGIGEVILTGGDPLSLADDPLLALLERFAAIDHVRLLRIHTRYPAVNPFRVTEGLAQRLGRLPAALWVATQFNHPREVTPEARTAVERLLACGIPVLNQTVLLRGVNDRAAIIEELMIVLLEARVKPYYLHHPDQVRRTSHLRVSLAHGLDLMRAVRGRIPGHAMPLYVLDLPGGHGKVPLDHANVSSAGAGAYTVTAPDGSVHLYQDGLRCD